MNNIGGFDFEQYFSRYKQNGGSGASSGHGPKTSDSSVGGGHSGTRTGSGAGVGGNSPSYGSGASSGQGPKTSCRMERWQEKTCKSDNTVLQ